MSNIEKKGVGWLGSQVAESKILEPYFKENDRTPSWDGSIFVYDKSIKKENLKDTVPVQIKSTEVVTLHSGRISYSLNILDIKNYYKIRGTILFVVEICGKERRGFIKSLLPSELKNILAGLEKNGPNSKIILDELDTSDSNQLEYICEHFLIHRKLQYSTIEYSLSITDVSELVIPIIPDGTPLEEHIFSKEHLLYGKSANETVTRYIENAKITSISQSLNRNVVINSKLYFSQYSETRVPDGRFFEFGKKIRIDIHDVGTANLSYELTGTVSEQITALSFLFDMVQTGTIYIGDGKLEISIIDNKENFIDKIQGNLNYLKDIESLFNSFRIDPDRLNILLLEKRDFAILRFLSDAIVHNKKMGTTPFQQGFNGVKVGDITLGVFVYKKADDTGYEILDLFAQPNNLKFGANIGAENFEISMYVILEQEFLTLVNNLDLAVVLSDIKKVVFSKVYGEATNLFALELIKAYDASNRGEFLDTASSIYEWLQQMEDGNLIYNLNALQITRRQRAYTKDEKTFLIQQQTQNISNFRILCAINILLENKSDAESNFDQLAKEEKEEFIQYPIFTLAKQFNMFKNGNF